MKRCFALAMLLPALGTVAASEPELTARLDVGRQRLVQHEIVAFTLTIASIGLPLGKRFDVLSLPDAGRLQRVSPFDELPAKRAEQAGRLWETRRFRWEAIAVATGTVEVAPVVRVEVFPRDETPTPGWPRVGTMREVKTPPLTLEVRPLPREDRPANFSGAVGQFTLEATAEPHEAAVGDLISVVTRIQGQGFLDGVQPLGMTTVPGFKVYPPRALPPSRTGEKAFEQILIPQSPRATEIPGTRFSYFDPDADGGRYRTLTAGPFHLSLRAEAAPSPAAPPAPGRPQMPLRWRDWLSPRGWWGVGCGFAILAMAIARVFRRSQTASRRRRLCPLAVGLIALACFAAALTAPDDEYATAVLRRDEAARLAPADTALETFGLPQGATVRVLEAFDSWAKVRYGPDFGWVPASSLQLSQGRN